MPAVETQVGPGQRILIPGIMSPWQPLEILVSVNWGSTRSGPMTAITVLGTSEMLFSLQAPFHFLGKEFTGLQDQ